MHEGTKSFEGRFQFFLAVKPASNSTQSRERYAKAQFFVVVKALRGLSKLSLFKARRVQGTMKCKDH